MNWISLASASINTLPLDWSGNREKCIAALEDARKRGSQFLVLPELVLSGYGCDDAFHGIATAEKAMASLIELAKHTKGMVVTVGLPVRVRQGLYNAVAFVVDGQVVGFVGKQHLPGDGIHYEPRFFRPWPDNAITTARVGVGKTDGYEVPFGDVFFEIGGVRIGAEICEDAWVPNRPGLKLAMAGCDIIINPSASHFALGKWPIRERIVREGSRAMGAVYVYSNLLGNESGRVIFDGELLIAMGGDLIARGPRLSFRDWVVVDAVVDVDLQRMRRARQTSFFMHEEGGGIVRVPFAWNEPKTPPTRPLSNLEGAGGNSTPNTAHGKNRGRDDFGAKSEDWRGQDHIREEEFGRSIALALHDYLRKSRAGGFVVSLSGGADSAACATLAALAYRFAVAELGEEEVGRRLPQCKLEPERFCGGLLDTVYQATANSGQETNDAAAAVAAALGARHAVWNVEELVRGYRARMEETLGRPMTWEHDDIALQNIQARVRAPGVWMLANVRNALLLTTSNRSEAAVGYATMDGDTAGSLAPIAGIDKNYLRTWLRWVSDIGPEGIGPIPAIAEVVKLPPMAELRPAARKQTDEGDLMPYDLLDAIEKLAIRDRMDPLEVEAMLQRDWAEAVGGPARLAFYVRRFFQLWCRNQWKRERFAPAFHLDDENLDPKTWCRFPILSGGYQEDLAVLSKRAEE